MSLDLEAFFRQICPSITWNCRLASISAQARPKPTKAQIEYGAKEKQHAVRCSTVQCAIFAGVEVQPHPPYNSLSTLFDKPNTPTIQVLPEFHQDLSFRCQT